MKKLLLIAVISLAIVGISGNAQAGMSLYYDLSSVGLGQTGVFDREVLTTVDATSSYALGIFPGAPFSDIGDLQMGALTLSGATIGDTEDLGTDWELTGRWTGLTGSITSITPVPGVVTLYSIEYTGGTANLYAGLASDGTKDVTTFNGIGSDDDPAGVFENGLWLGTLSLITGNGALTDYVSPALQDGGFTFTTWAVTDVPTGVWRDTAGNDLELLLETYGRADINTLVADNVAITGGGGPGSKIQSRNTGDAQFNAVVPEPTSMLLLGMGILGLATSRRKKVA